MSMEEPVRFQNRQRSPAQVWAIVLTVAVSTLAGCSSNPTATVGTIDACDVRQFLLLRSSFNSSVGDRGEQVFRRGRVLSKEARALLAPFWDRLSNHKGRYVIGAGEIRHPSYWWVTVSVDSETSVITGYEYSREEEDRFGRETVGAREVRQFLKLRNSFDPSLNNTGARIFRKGRALSEGARALLAPFRDELPNGKARYVISANEIRYPLFWWVTVSVDSETSVITDCDYLWEEEDRSDWEGYR